MWPPIVLWVSWKRTLMWWPWITLWIVSKVKNMLSNVRIDNTQYYGGWLTNFGVWIPFSRSIWYDWWHWSRLAYSRPIFDRGWIFFLVFCPSSYNLLFLPWRFFPYFVILLFLILQMLVLYRTRLFQVLTKNIRFHYRILDAREFGSSPETDWQITDVLWGRPVQYRLAEICFYQGIKRDMPINVHCYWCQLEIQFLFSTRSMVSFISRLWRLWVNPVLCHWSITGIMSWVVQISWR